MSDVVDLDALVPKPVTIKFGDENIEVKPPKTIDVLRIGALGQKIKDISELDDQQTEQLVTELTTLVTNSVPQLKDKDLNTAQLLKLVQIISEMSMPPELAELNKQGITPDGPKVQ